eukprot:COSAG03_NODE_26487_length_259_cov_0.512500_2_plen_27_part_01
MQNLRVSVPGMLRVLLPWRERERERER